ncbi:PINc domain-containing protein [Mycena sanguinolenta]|uniref:PINc domain-containing protein n=1 Tax=Mycena sanguinolenta TaxID=230812 RepID=A0A8H7CLZ8_9AGAR|nr:PINc domain-containing protein [Mycena sanguinolenta]
MTTKRGGSVYWMAPELLDPDRFGMRFARTPASDVYAFGCVCLELYTGRPPFSGVLPEPGAMMKVINGERPPRPSSSPAMSDVLWNHVSTYWAQEPTIRPTTQLVVQYMFWPPMPAVTEIQDLPPASGSRSGSPANSERSLASTAYWTAVSSLTNNSTFSDFVDRKNNPTNNVSDTVTFLKKLYRTIVYLEGKVKEKDNGASPNELERLEDREKWKQRIKDHKERVFLAGTIHCLLQASVHPDQPVSMRTIPIKYNLIARLWSSFHMLLESLRRASVASALALEHLQDSFYHVYSFYTNVLEDPLLKLFKSDWLTALGHLARYKMNVITLCDTDSGLALAANAIAAAGPPAVLAQSAIDLLELSTGHISTPKLVTPPDSPSLTVDVTAVWLLEPERDLWRRIARDWYSAGIVDQPSQGRFHHYLALLNSEVELGQLRGVYHFGKSLTTQFPFILSREALLPMWSVDAQARRALPEAHLVDLFLLLHGMLFTDIRFDNFQATLRRFVTRLETEGVEERDWIMMSIVNVCAVLEYGNPAGVLKKAAMSTDAQKAVAMDVEERETDSHPAFPTRTASFSSALQLMFVMLSHVFHSPTLENGTLNPYLTVVLTFLATVLQYPQALAAMESSVPWTDLATFFTRIPVHIRVDRVLSEAHKSSEEHRAIFNRTAPLLPEDWCLRGMEWVSWSNVYSPELWKGGRDQRSEFEVLDSSAESQDSDDERRWVRIVRCAGDIAQAVDGLTFVQGVMYQWRIEGAPAKHVVA